VGFDCAKLLSQSPNQPANGTPPLTTFHAERNEVQVLVTVRDRDGHAISNLTQDNFEIRDNGRKQAISNFAIQRGTERNATQALSANKTGVPVANTAQAPGRRFIALFLDDVQTAPGDLARVLKAAKEFVQHSLQPQDRVSILKASAIGEVTYSNDKQKLLAAIDAVRPEWLKNDSAIRRSSSIDFETILRLCLNIAT
jgi:VWFA-related protein